MSTHDAQTHTSTVTHAPAETPRRDPFGLGLPRRPDWESFGVHSDADQGPQGSPRPDDVVEVRRSGLTAGIVGVVAAGLGLAWLGRSLADGGALTWTLTGVLALVALAYLSAFVDARVPLAVLDAHGVRMRLGRTWQGLPWESVDRVEYAARATWWKDGRLLVVPFESDEVVDALDRGARWHAWWATRWYGGAFALPLGLSTRVRDSDDRDLGAALDDLVDPAVDVVWTLPPAPVEAPASDETGEVTAGEVTADEVVDEVQELNLSDHLAVDELAVDERAVARQAATDAADGLDGGTPTGDDRESAETPAEAETVTTRVRRVGPWAAELLERAARWRAARRSAEPTAEPADPADPAVDAVDPEHHADLRDREDRGPAPVHAASEAFWTPHVVIDPVSPLREPRTPRRVEVTADIRQHLPLPEADALLQRPDDGGLEAYERPIDGDSAAGSSGTSGPSGLVAAPEPGPESELEQAAAREPVIGPVLVGARERLGLSVDQLAERTRIRPHVIEAIEVDDFAACGGDFYARGHLRTLSRIVGVDAVELIETYDAAYGHEPIDARRVFEAELASVPGGSLRATRGGPNWSVLVAAVMSLILLWSVAQLLFDGTSAEPESSETAGLSAGTTVAPATIELTAPAAAVSLTVRDAAGEIVWQGSLEAEQSHTIEATPPVRVSASDGAVRASIDGGEASELGSAGTAVQRSLSP